MHTLNSLPLPKSGKRDVIEEIIATSLKMVADSGFIESKMHVEKERGELLHVLEGLGLTKDGIPLFLGGHWRFEMFYEWCMKQERVEREKYKGLLLEENPSAQSTVRGDEKEDKAFKKRQADIINSRRKRERKRQEFANLQKEAELCRKTHKRLVAENKRLEEAWKAAQLIEENMSPEERLLYGNRIIGAHQPATVSQDFFRNTQMHLIQQQQQQQQRQQQQQQQQQQSRGNSLHPVNVVFSGNSYAPAAGIPPISIFRQEQLLSSRSAEISGQMPLEPMLSADASRGPPATGGNNTGISPNVNAMASQILTLSPQEKAQVIAMLSATNGR